MDFIIHEKIYNHELNKTNQVDNNNKLKLVPSIK